MPGSPTSASSRAAGRDVGGAWVLEPVPGPPCADNRAMGLPSSVARRDRAHATQKYRKLRRYLAHARTTSLRIRPVSTTLLISDAVTAARA